MSKKSFIDSIDVKSPCSEEWNDMQGNNEVRFCSHCSKHVNNLSEMTRKQAVRLVRRSDGNLCIRYLKHSVTQKPIFAGQLFQITRRAPRIAASVMSATISLSTISYGQTGSLSTRLDSTTAVQTSNLVEGKSYGEFRQLSGSVVDPNGDLVPNAEVLISNKAKSQTQKTVTNEKGVYIFDLIENGTYLIQAYAPGFENVVSTVEVDRPVVSLDLALSIEKIAISVDVVNSEPLFQAVSGGIGFADYSTPLAKAVANDDTEEVIDLIAKGANVNGKDDNYDGITPLFVAIENGNAEIARILIDAGANVNARDTEKQTPIMRLDDDATPELAELLIRHGAKINVVDKEKETVLILAAGAVDAKVLGILIDAGADIHAANKEGQTALMEAAENDDLESVRLLLQRGAKVNVKNKAGDTALDLTSDDEVEELLKTYGAVSGDPDQ